MALPPGTKLGPYEILAPIGAGGMGEVYRAKDPRLGREVAIKVLPESFSRDADRLKRFESEARAAGILNHPNLTAVHDIGTYGEAPYVVMELLEGETLGSRLSEGALPPRKAIDYAVQVARGLAAAHDKGIVHRDLKPENLFVTREGRVKILDFGLAKLTQPEGEGAPRTDLPTATPGTAPGVVMGTVGYMSPEQVKGTSADARSDIFSFGAILYEMLSGRRPFRHETAAETMSAILKEDPADLSAANRNIPPGLEMVVRHCLEKNPEERFHSAHDLAFDLQALSGASSLAAAPIAVSGARSRAVPLVAAALAAIATLAAGYFLGRQKPPPPLPSFRQLTFQRGPIHGARFGSDGKTILYSASWSGPAAEVYVVHPESPESRHFGLPSADILAVSSAGELAVALGSRLLRPFGRSGTLARVGPTGGAARELLEDVQAADWSPDGKELAVVRAGPGRSSLEFPIGKSLYEKTTGWIGDPRISPAGDRIAFVDHPSLSDDGGVVAIVDRAGQKKDISPLFASAQGLAWSPDGSEIWFTAAETGGNRALHAVTPSGRRRELARVTGMLQLRDVASDGRVLLTHEVIRTGISALPPGETRERDLSWLDWSILRDLSEDGRTVLFGEEAEGGGTGYSVFIRRTDGSPAVRLGEGSAFSLSPDGKRVLAMMGPTTQRQLRVYPTGAGESKDLPFPNHRVGFARFLPDGRRFLVGAAETGRGSRIYLGDTDGAKPRPLTAEGYREPWPSPDGARFLARGPGGLLYVCAVDGGPPVAVDGLTAEDSVYGWTSEPGTIYARKGRDLPARIVRLELATGRTEPWRDLMPPDATGISGVWNARIAKDGTFYAYSYGLDQSNLFLVEGLK